VQFSKTVGESDVYLFAGITGDFAANHVNEQLMKTSRFGGRMAHGALLVGYMSTCATMMTHKAAAGGGEGLPHSAGFDRIRFIKPVFLGDTVSLTYSVTKCDPIKRRAFCSITVANQENECVAIAENILQWVDA
jgi:acyl dehydratase